MKKILIPIGYKQRELNYLSLLATFLETANFEVKLMYSNFEVYEQIYTWQPNIILLGQVNQPENIQIAQYAHDSQIKVVVLNCEGTYDLTKPVVMFGKKLNSFVDLLIVWGKQHYQDALQTTNLPAKKISLLSTPKFDFYKKSLLTYYQQKKSYPKLDKTKKTICIATSFVSADETWEQIKHIHAYQQLGQQKVEKKILAHQQLRDKFIELANELAKTKQFNLIFRPHPLENKNYYLGKLKSKQIIFDNLIDPVELFSNLDVLIHRNSTLACEAWMNQVLTLSFDPIYNADQGLGEVVKHEQVFQQQNRLIKFLLKQNFKVSAAMKQKQQAYLLNWFGFKQSEKKLSAQKIAIKLSQLKIDQPQKIWHVNLLISFTLKILQKIFRKQNAYEIIALIKGKKYQRLMSTLVIAPAEVTTKKKLYQKILANKNVK